ncbi:hypothetical protein ACFYRG_32905 [Streptomyces mirabilis]|uniref:hypothetical protein n=1 Tax=Streptomyces mirabilis TaxID=68239 RepID=UPI0036949035
MGLRQRFVGLRQPWQSGHAPLVIPVVLIVVITVVDILVPAYVHLGPLLVIASAITASFAGPLLTGVIGALAVAAQAFTGWHFGVLFSRNVMVHVLALAVLSSLIVFFCVVRKQHRRRPAQVRSVAEAAQHVLSWPLPDRPGPLQQDGTFCPFVERAARWTERDLLAHTGACLDAASLIAIRRMPTRHAGHHHGKPVSRASEPRSWNRM